MVEKAAASLAAPQERLRKLLEAKDKKAMLLEMAGARVGGEGTVGSVGWGVQWLLPAEAARSWPPSWPLFTPPLEQATTRSTAR